MKDLNKRFRELELIKDYETVTEIKDYSEICKNWKEEDSDEYHGWSGQVIWWLVEVSFSDSTSRKYIMKCPYESWGSDSMKYFVDRRVEMSEKLINAGCNTPRIMKYDSGTMIHERIEGLEFNEAVKRNPEKRGLYESKREELVTKIEKMGFSLLTENMDSNFIVTANDDVYLIDLDLTEVG